MNTQNIKFVVLTAIWLSSATVFAQNQIELLDGENIVMECRGSYVGDFFAQPGRVYLTDQRMYFITTKLATKRYEHSILLGDIESVVKTSLNVKLGAIGSASAITVKLKSGPKLIFQVKKRKVWIPAIYERLDE